MAAARFPGARVLRADSSPAMVDPETGRVFVFQSEGFWFDPAPFLAGHTTLPVYVQPGNYRRYAVDTAGIVPPEG